MSVPLNLAGINSDSLVLTLGHAMELAVENAVELKTAKSLVRESELSMYQLQESLKPQISASAVLPNLSRSIEARQLPDGRDVFVNRSTMYNSVGVNLDYDILSTGGRVYASSRLERLDILKSELLPYAKNYFFTPITVGFSQPFFEFNQIKWERERNKLLNNELILNQALVRENILNQVVYLYTNAFNAQLYYELAKQDIVDSDALFRIKKRLYDKGKLSKVELLRLELEKEINEQSLARSSLELEKHKKELFNYIRVDLAKFLKITLEAPPSLKNIYIDEEKAIILATKNEYITANHYVRNKEAEIELEKSKKREGIKFSIDVSVGLNNTVETENQLFSNILDQERLSMSLFVPINNKRIRQLYSEIANEQLIRTTMEIENEITDLALQIKIVIDEYNLSIRNVNSIKKSMEIANDIYELIRKQYLMGDKTITELNIAQNEKTQTIINYYNNLLETTSKYYEIRKLCLFDFESNKDLTADF